MSARLPKIYKLYALETYVRICYHICMQIKKIDLVILISCLVVFGLLSLLVNHGSGKGGTVLVSVNGEEIARYSLDTEGEYTIEGYNGGENTLLIHDGEAEIIEASCPDGLCVKQKSVSLGGETICCLPNRVIVEVISTKDQEVDAVAR